MSQRSGCDPPTEQGEQEHEDQQHQLRFVRPRAGRGDEGHRTAGFWLEEGRVRPGSTDKVSSLVLGRSAGAVTGLLRLIDIHFR